MINSSKSFHSLIYFFSLVLMCIASCQEAVHQNSEHHEEREFKSYKIFEEPTSNEIKDLKFYFLGAYWGGLGNSYLLSIRKDKYNNSYGYFKVIDRDMMPPISNMVKSDTFSFIYSSTYFKLRASDIDSLQQFIQHYHLSELKDSLIAEDLDGKTRELIVFDKGRFLNVFRSGSKTSLERNYIDFFDTVLRRYTPPEPLPSFRR